ncbi:hypothetical protein [Spongiimicrobium salis]|uniref:hypothetical protein n=1 Tax=Spongiimicrobium salis TaxID=1667022 RepID=UPI00374CD8F1
MTKVEPTFHLGITMAGAVSAGCYTAGFMDYLLETLNKWEEAKSKNRQLAAEGKEMDKRIPMHNVAIDVLGGASAGGMVSMITTLAFYQKDIKPVLKPSYTKTGNILYDSWVLLEDDLGSDSEQRNTSGKTTFEKMLDTDDLEENPATASLLNSKPIDHIAERVFNQLPKNASSKDFPNFVSQDLRVILTVTSLKPISYIVNFSRLKSAFMDTHPGHRIDNHEVIAHFKVDYDPIKDKDLYLPFRPQDDVTRDFLIKTTKATGAFPIGLAPRHFNMEFTGGYISNSLKRKIAFSQNMDIDLEMESSHFKFTGVDGGTINNEPFDEVLRCLMASGKSPDPQHPDFGTIMIDPFPNFKGTQKEESVDFQKGMFDVLGKLVPTILNQARNKRNDTFGRDFFKLLVFPIKWEGKGELKDHPPLATGGLGGFGGFLDIDFRIHDYFLGRNNARNFLRAFLFLEHDKSNPSPLFAALDKEAIEIFSREVEEPESGKEKMYMPIIPDMSLLDINTSTNPYFYDVDTFPKLDRKWVEGLRKPLKNRIKKILKKEAQAFKKWYIKPLLWLGGGMLANKIAKKAIAVIIQEFQERKM